MSAEKIQKFSDSMTASCVGWTRFRLKPSLDLSGVHVLRSSVSSLLQLSFQAIYFYLIFYRILCSIFDSVYSVR